MRDLTVLHQIAAHLDGWSGLRARVVTEGVTWPSVQLQAEDHAQTWRCEHDHWTGQVLDDNAVGDVIATIQTIIPEDAAAGEVADGIKVIYRMLTEREGAGVSRPSSCSRRQGVPAVQVGGRASDGGVARCRTG